MKRKKKAEVIPCRPHLYSHGGYDDDYDEGDTTWIDELLLVIFFGISLVLLPLYIWILVFYFIYNLIRGEIDEN